MEKQNDTLVIDLGKFKVNEQKSVAFISDVHFDNKECDRKALKRILDKCKEKKIPIIIGGDFFDAMGAKHDPRSSKKDILPQYCNGTYFDAIVDDAVEFLKPYNELIQCIMKGNHEISVEQRQEIDLIKNLVNRLNVNIIVGSYNNWIKYVCHLGKDHRIKTHFHTHGAGGNSPVTRGVIGVNRRAVLYDADIISSEHLHSTWEMVNTITYIDQNGNLKTKDQLHFQTSTFKAKDEWAENKGFGKSPICGRELVFEYLRNKDDEKDEKKIVNKTALLY